MIDWLRSASDDPTIAVGDAVLPVVIRRHPTARRIVLRLAPDGSEVRLTMPRWGATREGLAFAESRREWLAQQLAAREPARCPFAERSVDYRGAPLALDWQRDAPRKPALFEGMLRLGGPEETRMGRLRRWLEGQAVELMEADLADYCAAAGIAEVPPLRLSRAQRRWGSCSSKGMVRINWRLVQAPDHVRRSVVAHETAHLVHFDHSPAFHALLGDIFGPDLPRAESWLKANGRSLYAAFG